MINFSAFLPALAGGVLIGLASGGLYLLVGEIAGISGIVRTAMTGPARAWRWAFVAGLLLAGLGAHWAGDASATAGLEGLSWPVLLAAGLLVGFGSGFGNGCTSGHGVCGLSRFSRRSLLAVATFMATAAVTVFIVRHGGLA